MAYRLCSISLVCVGSLFAQVYFCSNNSGSHWPVSHLSSTGHWILWAKKGPWQYSLPIKQLLCSSGHNSYLAVVPRFFFYFSAHCCAFVWCRPLTIQGCNEGCSFAFFYVMLEKISVAESHFVRFEIIVCFWPIDIFTWGILSKSALLSVCCTSLLCFAVAAIALII